MWQCAPLSWGSQWKRLPDNQQVSVELRPRTMLQLDDELDKDWQWPGQRGGRGIKTRQPHASFYILLSLLSLGNYVQYEFNTYILVVTVMSRQGLERAQKIAKGWRGWAETPGDMLMELRAFSLEKRRLGLAVVGVVCDIYCHEMLESTLCRAGWKKAGLQGREGI